MTTVTARRQRPRCDGDQGSESDYLRRVNDKIAAAVAEAPPIPEDVAARLVDLIRATPTPSRRAA